MEMQFNEKKSTWKGSGGKINYFKYVNRLQMVKKVLASCRAFLMLKNTSWKKHVLPGQVSDKSDRFPEWTGRNQYLFNKFKFKRGGNKKYSPVQSKTNKMFFVFLIIVSLQKKSVMRCISYGSIVYTNKRIRRIFFRNLNTVDVVIRTSGCINFDTFYY